MPDQHQLDLGHVDRAVFGMWMRIDDPMMAGTIGAALVDELRRELPPGHPLSEATLSPLFMCLRCDDVVFRLSPNRFARTHLTWDQKQAREPLPLVDMSESSEALLSSMARSGCKTPEQATFGPDNYLRSRGGSSL